MRDYDWLQSVKDCPVYKPSFDEFEDPFQYIQSIAKEASEYGICKIIPPLAPSRPANMVLTNNFKFKTTVQPLQANNGQIVYDEGRIQTLAQFEVKANKFMNERYNTSLHQPLRFLETEFWHELLEIKKSQVEHGINIEASGFSDLLGDPLASSAWNLKSLPKLSKCLLRHVNRPIPGVSEPMMYIGMLFGTFAWHVEDNYLYSINYNHCGAPKTWYGVPGKHATLFEKLAEREISKSQFKCKVTSQETNGAYILAKKTTMFPPNMLLDSGVMVSRASQLVGEFVITFPRAYHAGFSNGFNIVEAVNFAPYDWLEFGKLAATNYAQIRTPNVLSCDEMILNECISFRDAPLTTMQRELAISFTVSVRMHKLVRWCLHKSPPEGLRIIQKCGEIVHCIQCGQDCYLSYVTHSESSDPVCIFHDWNQFKDCTLHLHKDITEIEDKAYMFEKDKEVELRAQDKMADIVRFAGNRWMMQLVMKGILTLIY